jgi:hypothetical protein
MPTSATSNRRSFVGGGLIAIVCLLHFSSVASQPTNDSAGLPHRSVAPVTTLIASDHKYDNGTGIDLSWVPSIDDRLAQATVSGYKVYRSVNGGVASKIAELPGGANRFFDDQCSLGNAYVYSVNTVSSEGNAVSMATAPIRPEREWINLHRINLLAIAVFISVAVFFFIQSARRGKKLFVRKIAGLDAVDDAIGRATEMGRPILFIPGIQDMDDVQTIAGITILGRVSRVVADYDTKIRMPVSRSLVMTAARETIKASYMAAGRPDAYNDDMVSYVTDEQFGYVAAVDGIMVREKPATCFYLGAFFAESLILAETGNSVGAIQIAGTAMPAQIPFFVAACDFTLIGEELFAASAYLSNEPKQLGSLKGQDVGKGVALAVIVVGTIAATIGSAWDVAFMDQIWLALRSVFQTN